MRDNTGRSIEGALWLNWRRWMAAAGIGDVDGGRRTVFSDTSHTIQGVIAGGVIGLADPGRIGDELSQDWPARLFDIGAGIERGCGRRLVSTVGIRPDAAEPRPPRVDARRGGEGGMTCNRSPEQTGERFDRPVNLLI